MNKIPCPECEGEGHLNGHKCWHCGTRVYYDIECHVCGGTGQVEADDAS